ncbi:MAG: DeoR/GlpR family DNA-binding transcription regulator [Paracoccaceae bacterium]
MSQSFRQHDILEIAREEGRVKVEDLAERFAVSVQTIRRDLSELADAGWLERVHGGAVLRSSVTNIGYEDRRGINEESKSAIGAACAREIPDGAALFLGIGTTTEAVAATLLHHRNLMVVTNNINVANILAANPDCEIVVSGGRLRRSDGGLVGNLTTTMLEQFRFDIAVIGCSAIAPDGELLDFDVQEVGVSQSIIRRARATWLVADHSKFERSAPVRVASLREVDRFFTDAALPEPLARLSRDWGTGVTVARAAAPA